MRRFQWPVQLLRRKVEATAVSAMVIPVGDVAPRLAFRRPDNLAELGCGRSAEITVNGCVCVKRVGRKTLNKHKSEAEQPAAEPTFLSTLLSPFAFLEFFAATLLLHFLPARQISIRGWAELPLRGRPACGMRVAERHRLHFWPPQLRTDALLGSSWTPTGGSLLLNSLAKLLIASLLLQAPLAWAQANFSTTEPDLLTTAEAARERSARFWSGKSLPGRWSSPCPVQWSNRSGPGSGMTCFQIQGGEVFGWRMTLCGDRDTVLRDVLPHEVDHTVRASLCRRPLPRWLDEGCASLFESESSHQQLRRLRQTSQTQQLQAATIDQLSYPASNTDTTQLYAEGFSLVEFLLSRGTPQDLLRVQTAREPPSQSLVQVYRTELPRLLSEWQTWEQKRLAQGSRCDWVNCPWHRSRQPSAISGQPRNQPPNSGPLARPTPPTRDTKPTLTIWTASWCGPCQQFHRDLAQDARFRARLESKFQLVERDFDQSSQAAAQSGITRIPVFTTTDRRVEGYQGSQWLLVQLGLEVPPAPAKAPPLVPDAPLLAAPQVTLPEPPHTAPILPPEIKLPLPHPTPPASASFWSRIVALAPGVFTVLSSLGIIGGTAVTGGVGGVALMLLFKILQRRATRAAQGKASSAEGGVAPPAHAPFPRQLDEAGELLGLRQSEGRVATLDALRGMFLDDELDKLGTAADPQVAALIRQIRSAVDNRVDEVAPLTTKG